MSLVAILIILGLSLVTSFISGIFGMAGGLILMGGLIALPSIGVATAMVIHGSLQFVANGWRAWLLRDAIDWTAFHRYAVGAGIGVAALALVTWQPEKRAVYLLLGLVPLMVWLPRGWFDLDIQKRSHALAAGLGVQALNTLAGVAGPMLDLFFVRNAMTRQQIVATKAVTQALSHVIKIGFWTVPAVTAVGTGGLPPAWFFLLAIPSAMVGTWLGGRVLDRLDDSRFKAWVRLLVTGIGGVMLLRAAGLV